MNKMTAPSLAEVNYAKACAQRLGLELVDAEPSGFAICGLGDDEGFRYPNSGGISFDEAVLILRRKAKDQW